MMSPFEYAATTAPSVVALFVTWLPSVLGNYIDSQARDLTREFERYQLGSAVLQEIEVRSADLAKVSALCSGFVASLVSFAWGAVSIIPHLVWPLAWMSGALLWGCMLTAYFLTTALTFKLHEWPTIFVRKPWGKHRAATFSFTHRDLANALITMTCLMSLIAATLSLLPLPW